jgi:transposase
MKAYSEDLRHEVVKAVERGMSKAQAARLFDVSLSSVSSVKRYAGITREGGSLTPKKSPGRPPRIDKKARELLEEDVKWRPAATVAQRRRFLEYITDTGISNSTVRRVLRRLCFSRKKDVGATDGTSS